MRPPVIAALFLCISCNGKNEQPKGQGADASEAKAACEKVFTKMATCREDMLRLARTGPVLEGALPEAAMESARFLANAIDNDAAEICAKGVPPDLAQGLECMNDDCRAMAKCMMQKIDYAPTTDGLQCGEKLTALEAKGQGKTLQWCIMNDGTPHGTSRVLDGSGNVLREQKYDRGKPVHVTQYVRRQNWWE